MSGPRWCGWCGRRPSRRAQERAPQGDADRVSASKHDMSPQSRGALRPRFAKIVRPKKRAQGMPGACCTRGLVCNKCEEYAHEHTGTAGALRHSLRDGLTAYTELSLETNSFCLHRRRIEGLPKPGWVDVSSASLTPATGARTTRLCRTQPRQSSTRCVRSRTLGPPCQHDHAPDAAASTASRPNVRDDGQRPSTGTGWREL
jgi:hypothetical protein